MNIEKSLDIIKGKLLMIDKMLKQDQEEGHGSAYEMQTEDFEAIETLLTAYEKEKEAIKDLEEYLHWEELQGFSMLPRDKHIETLLNLVSTLIAENKELKDSNVELATTIDCLQTDLKEINEEYNAEQKHEMENTISKSKVEEILNKYKYTEIEDSEKIIQFYKDMQSLLGKK